MNLGVVLSLVGVWGCATQEAPRESAAVEVPIEASVEAPAAADESSGGMRVTYPNIEIDLEGGRVDVAGRIVLREGLLELVACVPGTNKDHESIVSLDARPQHIHAALLMVGLEPGHPGHWAAEGDQHMRAVDARGDGIRLTVVWREGDQTIMRPVEEMILSERTGETMAEGVFVFAGSAIRDLPESMGGGTVYSADMNGTVVTLVTFPDEMVALPTAASSSNDMVDWRANGAMIPPLGTRVVLRFEGAGE